MAPKKDEDNRKNKDQQVEIERDKWRFRARVFRGTERVPTWGEQKMEDRRIGRGLHVTDY